MRMRLISLLKEREEDPCEETEMYVNGCRDTVMSHLGDHPQRDFILSHLFMNAKYAVYEDGDEIRCVEDAKPQVHLDYFLKTGYSSRDWNVDFNYRLMDESGYEIDEGVWVYTEGRPASYWMDEQKWKSIYDALVPPGIDLSEAELMYIVLDMFCIKNYSLHMSLDCSLSEKTNLRRSMPKMKTTSDCTKCIS